MTDVEVCNLALDNISVTNKIAALNAAGTKEERACARWFALVRDSVLAEFPWPFASAVAEPTQITSEEHAVWTYLYTAPTSMLKARRIFLPGQLRNQSPPMPFATLLNEAGTAYIIGCDTDGILLEYTRKVDNNDKLALVPPAFIDALLWKLAARLVKPLSLDADLIKEAEAMYMAMVAKAFSSDTETYQRDQPEDAEWIKARG
jgi:hypothetical protein